MAVENLSPSRVESTWYVAQRWQAYEAELRANLLRIIAIGAFYMVHLWTYFGSRGWLPNYGFLQVVESGEITRKFHILVTLIAVAWAMLALGILLALQHRIFPRWLPYFSTGCDVVMLTSIVMLGGMARSPLVVGYFLILIVATLRLSLPLIWYATCACAIGYLCVLGCAKWPEHSGLSESLGQVAGDLRVPRYHQLTILLAIGLAGVMLGQIARRFRKFAEDVVPKVGEKPSGA
jgi:hypothetical protein